MDTIKEFLEITKEILVYWVKEILEKGFYLLIIIILVFLTFYISNPYGRYFDAWLE